MFLEHFRGPAGPRRAPDPHMEIMAPVEITTPTSIQAFTINGATKLPGTIKININRTIGLEFFVRIQP